MHLQWLENDFLGYLREWEESIEQRDGYSKDDKRRMTLSQETMRGLRMTGMFSIASEKFIRRDESATTEGKSKIVCSV